MIQVIFFIIEFIMISKKLIIKIFLSFIDPTLYPPTNYQIILIYPSKNGFHELCVTGYFLLLTSYFLLRTSSLTSHFFFQLGVNKCLTTNFRKNGCVWYPLQRRINLRYENILDHCHKYHFLKHKIANDIQNKYL